MTTSSLTEAEKNAIISSMIKRAVDSGMPVDEAVDLVCGAGTYRALSDKLHDAFNASK